MMCKNGFYVLIVFSFLMPSLVLALNLDKNLMSFAFKVEKRSIISLDESSVGYYLICNSNDKKLCQSLCQDDSACLLNEDACEACISASELNVFSFLTDFESLYQVSKSSISAESFFNNFYKKSLMLMDAYSIFNFLIDASDESALRKLQEKFNYLCPSDSNQSFLAVSTDPKTFLKLSYVICQSQAGTFIYQSEYSKEYDNQ